MTCYDEETTTPSVTPSPRPESPVSGSASPVVDLFKPYYKSHRYLHRSEVGSDPDILDPCSCRTYSGGYTVTEQSSPVSDRWSSAVNLFVPQTRASDPDSVSGHHRKGIYSSPHDSSRPGPHPDTGTGTSTSSGGPFRDSHERTNEAIDVGIGGGGVDDVSSGAVYTTVRIAELPGLEIISGLLSHELQQQLVVDTVREYLPPKEHLTNLDVHYHVPRPFNIFDDDVELIHKIPAKPPLTMSEVRAKKLRWVTIGGQYNWTTKVYPSLTPGTDGFPFFPPRLANLLSSIFKIKCEAAIVNFYSPGDILSPHQDVAELAKADLVSVSLGCDCVFYVGKTRDSKPLPILLRSGDIIVMGGDSRFAYHGVGRVWPDTCPSFLTDFDPGFDRQLYRSWVANKRININVRQML
ncbi:hypothetical protein AWJ20_4317 [Sugiyamaella lignohabitans]|uniref:Fe2OG dioxygenase domain-containing protein n=1 Tax=Sugiyamaella lignohabitans TaxID=796027 RepID=A0A167CCC5_9ASCO|nr:uncharacterized protein AWJ20_4317 [Sugiyamaella lignohabitans]ANB11502.1 hypothetical protein AWJ20_4317 [Sugiyamaella lignohabitans]